MGLQRRTSRTRISGERWHIATSLRLGIGRSGSLTRGCCRCNCSRRFSGRPRVNKSRAAATVVGAAALSHTSSTGTGPSTACATACPRE